MLRWHIFRLFGFQLALHKILRDDDDRALHDHSGDNVSLILNEGYCEIVRDVGGDGKRHERAVWRFPLWPYFRKAELPHRIVLADSRPVWTLWLRWPPRRDWGFHCPSGWRHWRDYIDGDYTMPSAVSKVGRGCD